MFFKTLFHSFLILSMFLVLSLSAKDQVVKSMVGQAGTIQATAIAAEKAEEAEDFSRATWLWRNEFQSTAGIISTSLLGNNDTLGGKTCRVIDDFEVPASDTWTLDTIRVYLFWYKQQADEYQIYIYNDEFGLPEVLSPVADFTFQVNLPAELTLYPIDVAVSKRSIELPGGFYWISVIAIYNTASMVDTFLTLWNRKDTLQGPNPSMIMDSLGVHYTPYPTPWLIYYFDGENTENSVRFWLRGNSTTGINNVNSQKPKSLVSVYPTPASDHITFRLGNTNGKYIEIYDVMGKLVKTVNARTTSQKVDIKPFTNGIYIYQVLNKSRNIVDRGRFSISK